jgi:hypothetical protein
MWAAGAGKGVSTPFARRARRPPYIMGKWAKRAKRAKCPVRPVRPVMLRF